MNLGASLAFCTALDQMKITPYKPDLVVDELSIVLLGAFNPTIFQPMWFASQDLLRGSEAEKAKIEIVHPDVSIFSAEWLVVQVTRDRFSAATRADAYKSHLCDLVQGVFAKLSHTPVHQMGINVTTRMRFRDEKDWHSFGHFVVPKSPWVGVLDKPGMHSVHVRGERSDGNAGHFLVSIEPDLNTRTDVLLRVNDHFDLPKGEPTNAATFAGMLAKLYEGSLGKAAAAADRLADNFLKVGEVDNGA